MDPFNILYEKLLLEHTTNAQKLTPEFIPNQEFIHLSSNADSLANTGWDDSKEGSEGGLLYKGISVTLPEYVDSWIKIAKLGGTTPVTVTLPPNKKMLDFYATFESLDASENKIVKNWAIKQNKWEITKRTQIAQYDEEGEMIGWMDDEPEEFDDEANIREYSGFLPNDNQDIFKSYVISTIPQACGVWYWDQNDPSTYSSPHGTIYKEFANQLQFTLNSY